MKKIARYSSQKSEEEEEEQQLQYRESQEYEYESKSIKDVTDQYVENDDDRGDPETVKMTITFSTNF